MKRVIKGSGAAIILAALVLLGGCAFGPGDRPPELPQPPQYGVMAPIDKTVAAQGVSQRLTPSQSPQQNWWELYGSSTLNALVEEGMSSNLDLESAERHLAAAQESWKGQTGASQLPAVELGAQAARQRDMGLPMPDSGTVLYNTFVGQAQIRYTFDVFGTIRYQNKALAERVGQQAHQLQAARNAVAANVVAGVISVAGLQAQKDTVQRLIILTDQEARDAVRQHSLGAASQATVLDARRRTTSLASQLPQVQSQLLAARHALAVLLGRTPDQAPAGLDFARLTVPENIPVVVPSALIRSRPDIQAAEASLRAAAADVGVATANMFPQLALSASMGQGGFDWPTAVSGAGAIWSVAASITQPIFRGGALKAQRRAALLTYDATVLSYKRTVLSAFQDVADGLAALEQDSVALQQADAARFAAHELYDIALSRVRLGALPPAAARAMAQQLAQAQLDSLRYSTARLLDTASLFHAMGK